MKHLSSIFFLSLLVLFTGSACCETKTTNKCTVTSSSCPSAMQQTHDFIKNAGHYFIATVDGDQPRVRPFGTIHIFDGKLYIQTGRKKNVARQLLANGRIELCAMKDGKWIRLSGTVVEDPRREAKASMLDAYPSLKSMYSADDTNTMVLYFLPGTATATIYSYNQSAPVEMKF